MFTNGKRRRSLAAQAAVAAAIVLAACKGDSTGGGGTFTVGGTVTGLAGVGCVLRNNGGDNLAITANGAFTFATPVASGAPFDVTVSPQPIGPNQTCAVTNGTGTATGNVTNVAVACTVTRPACAAFTGFSSVRGDAGADVVNTSATAERWYRTQVIESSTSSIYVSATVALTVPPGIDYDLYVFCIGCGGALAGSSIGATGVDESVTVRWEDRPGPDDTAYILIQVRYFSGSSATPWALRVTGNTPISSATCTL